MEKLKQVRLILTELQFKRLRLMADYHHNSVTEEIRAVLRDAWWSYAFDISDLPFPDAGLDPFAVDDHYPDE